MRNLPLSEALPDARKPAPAKPGHRTGHRPLQRNPSIDAPPSAQYVWAVKEFTPYQKKVVQRYYDNRDAIMLTKLQEMATELYLADTDKKRERIWQRVHKAMINLKIKDAIIEHIMSARSPEVLAMNIEDWLRRADAAQASRKKT